jgi:hypothetical protein
MDDYDEDEYEDADEAWQMYLQEMDDRLHPLKYTPD